MDDFSIGGDVATKVQLTLLTLSYVALFYFAFVVFFGGLFLKIWRSFRPKPTLAATATSGSRTETILRTGADIVLFRSTFFRDLWAWIFAICLHFGFILIVLRHLRYALDPSWTGPFWTIVVMAQPFGIYGGLLFLAGVAGFFARRLLMPSLRETSTSTDYLLLVLMLAIAIVGFLNARVHTDVIAVKAFFVGLARFDWQPLPTDPFLLLHLWLVAVLIIALPFSKLLHIPKAFVPVEDRPILGKDLRFALVVVIGILLLIPAGVAAKEVLQAGWTRTQPDFSKLARAHKVMDQTIMVRNHPLFLMNHRAMVVYKGKRVATDTIEQCVTCHAVKGADGLPVGYDDPKHFCRTCHIKAAVTIDCFECHNSKPAQPDKHAELSPEPRAAMASADPFPSLSRSTSR